MRASHAFDQQLAQALGIEMDRNGDGERDDIAVILANAWWDDGVGDEPVPDGITYFGRSCINEESA